MFDPEKVQRYLSRGTEPVNYFNSRDLPYTDEGGITWVKASDYEQLLEKYRNLSSWADGRRDLPQKLWSGKRCDQVSAEQQDPRTGSRLEILPPL